MSAHVICVTSGSGLPIFSRRKGNTDILPFSIIGSLNGVHMFSKSQRIDLLNTQTEDYCVTWKEFNDSVVLIGISSGCTTEILNRTLKSVFNAIILIVGIEEVKNQRNIERLKRELKLCYPVIDRLLDSLDCGDSNKHASDLVEMVETILCPENQLLKAVLESFSECVDSLFSCIIIHGKIATATEHWWTLHPDELKLLSLLATAENTTTSKDIPVFLPFKSPTIAFRFVCCTLIPEVQLCCLCGPTPPLSEIEVLATQCFKNSADILSGAIQCHPRNFSGNIDGGILGLLLVNSGKYMISRNPHQNSTKKSVSSHRLDILRTFYYQTVFFSGTDSFNLGNETYWCSEYHKCYAMKVNDNILCVLFNSSIPTFAMRQITEKTLKLFINDKQICW